MRRNDVDADARPAAGSTAARGRPLRGTEGLFAAAAVCFCGGLLLTLARAALRMAGADGASDSLARLAVGLVVFGALIGIVAVARAFARILGRGPVSRSREGRRR